MDDLWRDVLLAFGVIIIVWIGWEAFRISRNKRNDMNNAEQENDQLESNDFDDEFSYGNELPSGGARTRKATDKDKEHQKTIYTPGEPVPILMKTVQRPIDVKPRAEDDEQITEDTDVVADDSANETVKAAETDTSKEQGDVYQQIALEFPETDAEEKPEVIVEEKLVPDVEEVKSDEVQAVTMEVEDTEVSDTPDTVEASESMVEEIEQQEQEKIDDQETLEQNQDSEVFVINVVARHNKEFDGQALLDLFLSCQLKFGEMDIFHYREAKTSAKLFSVANGVNPGTFDLHGMGDLTTPGIMFFMQVPNKADPDRALDYMYKAACHFAEELDGCMQDELRSVLTPQTFEFYKQRLQDFKRAQLVNH